MQIIEVDPDKKYVLVVPTQESAEELRELWAKFMEGSGQAMFIFGQKVALVSTDQIVGYKILGDDG